MDVGELLRTARARHGVSQRGLAVRAGTSQGYVSQVERGEVSPTVEALDRLLAVLGVRVRAELVPLDAPTADPGSEVPEGYDPGPALAAFAARDVELVVVGGLAARAHGFPVPGGTLEVTLDPEPRNQERLTRALGDLQARMARIVPAADGSRALAQGATFHFTSQYGPLVLAPSRTSYLALARRSTIAKVGGVAVPCAGRDDLIARARPGGVAADPALLAPLTREPAPAKGRPAA